MPSEGNNRSSEGASPLLSKEKEYYDKLLRLYDLNKCLTWISTHKFNKVCLQFPESLLIDSVDIAAYLESRISKKVYILGDTAYGSCCVDEIAARHVDGDAVIHFGHACLSPVSIPVYYVFLKKPLDVNRFVEALEHNKQVPYPVLIIYQVSYSHVIGDVREQLREKSGVCVSQLVTDEREEAIRCSAWCSARGSSSSHSRLRLHRSFCLPPAGSFLSIIFIGDANITLFNFLYVFQDCQVYHYNDSSGMEEVCRGCTGKQLSYLVERIRNSERIGIVVATLGVRGYREAVEHAKQLIQAAGKKSYILSVGKPNPAKLANFSEIDLFVAISCPESDFGDKKEYLQPIVGLFELDAALNKARSWPHGTTRDFRDVIKGDQRAESQGEIVSPPIRVGSFGQRVTLVESVHSGSSLSSVSETSLARLATAASMRSNVPSNITPEASYHRTTYNLNKLMAQLSANRAAQSLIHQMKTVSKDDVPRMKAYQVELTSWS